MDFAHYEVVKLRKVRRLKIIGKILIRTYDVPMDSAAAFESTTLARNTILPGAADLLTSPRVKHLDYAQPPNKGIVRFVITWIQPEAYA